MLDRSTNFNSIRTYGPRVPPGLRWFEIVLGMLAGIAIAAIIMGLSGPDGAAGDFLFLG